MCGIVCYFGVAGNALNRLLTGMSAIIYRAPDSTGIGLFGDEHEPLRVRRSLGSVSDLARSLLSAAAYPNQSEKLRSLWVPEKSPEELRADQRRLLEWEKHSPEIYGPFLDGYRDSLHYFELIETDHQPAPGRSDQRLSSIRPGIPGRVAPLPTYPLRSVKELTETIRTVTRTYDISAVVLQTLIRDMLEKAIMWDASERGLSAATEEILAAFDRIYEDAMSEEAAYAAGPPEPDQAVFTPNAWALVWYYLSQAPFRIPPDYDPDGVRGIFRLLETALMSRLMLEPEIHATIQRIFESLWPEARYIPNTDWKMLYTAERGVNVFGWGAAAALTYLQKTQLFPLLWERTRTAQSPVPAYLHGHADPRSLRFFAEPIIGHGRWALQSEITLKNSHPFYDAKMQRAIVLNGHFSGTVESEAREFLEQVVGVPFRTENSTEYFALLWGYYYENLIHDQKRYESIRLQVDAGLEKYHIGSHSVDYKIYRTIRDKTPAELDAMAFVNAARRMKADGGQIAAAGISLRSPRTLYVACHNRPAFIVQRAVNDDIMVVSDINAALGLFPQSLIQEKAGDLRRMQKRHAEVTARLKASGATDAAVAARRREFDRLESEVLEPFRITVYPLEGEEIFVRVTARFENGGLARRIELFDFKGEPLTDIESFSTVINPLQLHKELYGSFYETHLHEIPERFRYILHYYLDDETGLPRFGLRERSLKRRFGKNLSGIRRLVLVGMGSAYNVGLMAKPLFHELMPEIDIRVIQPVEFDDLKKAVFPETDLVVLLSWSSTTADMVEFAKGLQRLGAMMVAVTEKVFADMALIAEKSGGLIPVLSGEEVTISGLKSTFCLLFCLNLFAVWLQNIRHEGGEALHPRMERLGELPDVLADMLADEAIAAFAGDLAAENRHAHACIVIGDYHSAAVCREAALKLEENSWVSIGKPLDYSEASPEAYRHDPKGHLVLINATSRSRLDEATALMRRLYEANVPFAALVGEGTSGQEDIARYSRGYCLCLPDLERTVQPFADLLFAYRFAFEFARVRGRKPDEFPRNRAKSLTAGRSREMRLPSAKAEFRNLVLLNRRLAGVMSSIEASGTIGPYGQSLWERAAFRGSESAHYRDIRETAALLHSADPLSDLLETCGVDFATLGETMTSEPSEGREIVFMPFDPDAEAVARNVAAQWIRYLNCSIHTVRPGERTGHFHEDVVVIALALRPPILKFIGKRLKYLKREALWIGPPLPDALAAPFRRSLGYATLPEAAQACNCRLYAALSFIFINGWGAVSQDRAGAFQEHFRYAQPFVARMVDDEDLRAAALAAMSDNRRYQTAFYVGPSTGVGIDWVNRFDRTSGLDMAWHPFGESAHGPLATVDNQPNGKYVPLESRSRMVSAYGEKRVAGWERTLLRGADVDRFISSPFAGPEKNGAAGGCPGPYPFFAHNRWYLPVLEPGYDTVQDNLILMDTTRAYFLNKSLDELATFGCRSARTVLITQDAFCRQPDKRALFKMPFSHLLKLPSLENGEERVHMSGFLLPFAMSLLGAALAEGSRYCRGKDGGESSGRDAERAEV